MQSKRPSERKEWSSPKNMKTWEETHAGMKIIVLSFGERVELARNNRIWRYLQNRGL